jgi:hypothetical protein
MWANTSHLNWLLVPHIYALNHEGIYDDKLHLHEQEVESKNTLRRPSSVWL